MIPPLTDSDPEWHTDLRKAAEMALDALEVATTPLAADRQEVLKAQQALRQALAQDEQEPVIDRRLKVKIGRQYGYALNEHWFYLQPADEYAEQALTKHSGISVPPKREWVGLTDEERVKCYETTGHYQTLRPQDSFAVLSLARAIEAKLKEKNT